MSQFTTFDSSSNDVEGVLVPGESHSTVYSHAGMSAAFSADLPAAEEPQRSPETKGKTIVPTGDFGSVAERFGDNPVGAPMKSSSGGSGENETMPVFPGRKVIGKGNPDITKPDGLYSSVPKGFSSRRSKKPVNADESLFPFNYVVGRKSDIKFTVGRDDRMSPGEARAKLRDIMNMFGVVTESHDFLYSFTHALLVTHALNGASMVGPCRATFHVDGEEFSFGDVVKCLGPGMRRFFRAYADETSKALATVLDGYDPNDTVSVTLCGQISSIAVSRKLSHFPYLIHDSADACVRTTVTEMAAVLRSKTYVLDGKPNSVEQLDNTID